MKYSGLTAHLRILHFKNRSKTFIDPTVAEEVLERIREGFFILGTDARITNINNAGSEYMNMPKEEIIGKTLEEVMIQDAANMFKMNYRKVQRSKSQTAFEISCENKIFSVKAFPKRYGGVAFFLKNETEVKNAEEKCNSALASKMDFITTASHELKTPLTALMLQIEMARKQLETNPQNLTDEKMQEILKRAYNDSLRISRLVEEMQDVSRAGNGQLQMKFDFFHLEEFFEESICSSFPNNDLKLHIVAPEIVYWDKLWMRQVMLNLISVILCYNVGAPLSLKVTTGGGYAFIEATSTGKSIAEENFGLAFFLWDEIIRLHKGKFKVVKGRGKNTFFQLQIPLRS